MAADPDWQAAMARRGLTDMSKIRICPITAGAFRAPAEDDERRMVRVLAFLQADEHDLAWAHPDRRRHRARGPDREEGAAGPRRVRRCRCRPNPATTTTRPCAGRCARACGRSRSPSRRDRASRSRAACCAGRTGRCGSASTCAKGSPCTRSRWPGGRSSTGPRCRRWWCRTATRGSATGRRTSTPASTWSASGSTRSSSAATASARSPTWTRSSRGETGEPRTVRNAICVHEEDVGILWKHTDIFNGSAQSRRQRRLVVSFFTTVGNYDYGFYWYFYLDGTIECEVKMTGVVFTAGPPGRRPPVLDRGGARPRRPGAPAPVLRAARHVRGRARQRGRGGRRHRPADRPGQPVRQRDRAAGDAAFL